VDAVQPVNRSATCLTAACHRREVDELLERLGGAMAAIRV